MTKEELAAVDSASLNILSNVGVKFPNKEALDALEGIGANIDQKTMVARFSEKVLKDTLKRAPRNVTLCARDPVHDLKLMKGHVHFCPSGCGVFVYDTDTRQRRTATRRWRKRS